MSHTVIQVQDVSKQYRLGQVGRRALNQDINRWLHRIRGKEDPYLKIGEENNRSTKGSSDYVWALQNINFSVQQGEVLGIIGRNGAGKSTLLKLLSKVTGPTTGQIKIRGKIASLLEVGTGFHPDLSGRENIFLNGAILGMTRKEIQQNFDAIVDFAGVERYIDTPVKRYSSGMYVRLAFAVAAHLEPDILIVDEVLAVGDAEFQKKCLGKMKDVSVKDGRTVLFVSHNMAAVSTLTEKCLFLTNGMIGNYGNTGDIIRYYLQEAKASSGVYTKQPVETRPSIVRAEVVTSEPAGVHKNGEQLEILIDVHMPERVDSMAVSLQVCNERELPVIYSYLFDINKDMLSQKGINRLRCVLPKCRLYQGDYYLKLHLAETKGRSHYESIDKVCGFEVQMLGETIEWGWQKDVCVYTEEFKWETI